jgi:phosphatidate cytidylyltransferase
LILRFSTSEGAAFVNVGTDTLFIVVIGVIANDMAAYFTGTAMGRTPLRDWISPAKSIEGLIGGTIGTFIAVVLVGMQSTTWNSFGDWFLLALVISVMAPLGDLAESMFKRNLNVKDFGTVLRGHGGVLDRFDSLLFVLPATYYLTLVIQPWG